MYKLVLVRHGQSQWNKKNLFTGWFDCDLSKQGEKEAEKAGQALKESDFDFDVVFTSVLLRATRTMDIVLDQMGIVDIAKRYGWQLNERFYGALQGKNKKETAKEYGQEQIRIWRRSYNTRPPALDENSEFYPGNDEKYKDLPKDKLPLTESLKDTWERILPYWQEQIAPAIESGKKILIVSHGSTSRAFSKYFDNISDKDIENVNIPTGIPLVYELNQNFKAIKHYYLGDPKQIKKAIQTVATQAKI